jgi:hypothetical protein
MERGEPPAERLVPEKFMQFGKTARPCKLGRQRAGWLAEDYDQRLIILRQMVLLWSLMGKIA